MHVCDRRGERPDADPVASRADGLLQGDLHRSRGLVRKQVREPELKVVVVFVYSPSKQGGGHISQCQSDYNHWVTPARQCLLGEPFAFSQVMVIWFIR